MTDDISPLTEKLHNTKTDLIDRINDCVTKVDFKSELKDHYTTKEYLEKRIESVIKTLNSECVKKTELEHYETRDSSTKKVVGAIISVGAVIWGLYIWLTPIIIKNENNTFIENQFNQMKDQLDEISKAVKIKPRP